MPGRVVYLAVAPAAGAPMQTRESVEAVAGSGLVGDRYAEGQGTYSDWPGDGRELTLIETEALDALALKTGIDLGMEESRRNVTTRGIALNDLVGVRFRIGEALCEGVRLCEPCDYLQAITGKAILEPLVHRAGLRANVLEGGTIRVGDTVIPELVPVLQERGSGE